MSPLLIHMKSYCYFAFVMSKKSKYFSLSVLPSCGATVTQNLTYLVQDITSNPTSKVCAYTLCPVSESVNRIRLDFTVCNYFPIFLSTEYLVKYQIIDLGHDIFHYVWIFLYLRSTIGHNKLSSNYHTCKKVYQRYKAYR